MGKVISDVFVIISLLLGLGIPVRVLHDEMRRLALEIHAAADSKDALTFPSDAQHIDGQRVENRQPIIKQIYAQPSTTISTVS